MSRATQGPHPDRRLLRGGKVTAAPRLAGPSRRAAPGAGVTPHRDRPPAVLPTKALRFGAPGNPRTASTPRSHTSLGAGVHPVPEAGHGSGWIIQENTRRKVITTEISDGSARGHTNARAVAMSGTTLGTAGIGAQVTLEQDSFWKCMLSGPWWIWKWN